VENKLNISKTRFRTKHSFARQFLSDKNIKMYCGNERILSPVGHIYDIKRPLTRFETGQEFIEEGEKKKITSYVELKELGFVIISERINSAERWSINQKVKYTLRRQDETAKDREGMPQKHYVEYDTYNKAIRLIGPRSGPLGSGKWVMLIKGVDRTEGGRPIKATTLINNPQKYLNKFILKLKNIEEKREPILIPEVAFMMTDSNEIVCIPRGDDMPSILITGLKGSGKCVYQNEKEDFILSPTGCYQKIVDKPKTCLILDENSKITKSNIKNWFVRTTNKVLEIKTFSGKKIKVTPEHPLLSIKGWKKAEDFKYEDYIGVVKKYDLNLTKEMKEEELEFLTYYLAIGENLISHYKFKGIQKSKDLIQTLKKVVKKIDPTIFVVKKGLIIKGRIHYTKEEYMEKLNDILKKNDLYHIGKHHIKIPDTIMTLCNKQIKIFLSLFFAIKGRATNRRDGLRIKIKEKIIASQIKHLFLRFGINVNYEKNDLLIEKIDINKFYEILTNFDTKKYEAVKKFMIKREKKDLINDNDTDIRWEKISNIKLLKGTFEVRDIEVEYDTHNFIANDFIIHNSFALHSLVSRYFWKPEFDYNIVILNDSSAETGTWCLPNNDASQIDTLRRLKEKPLPLPCVYLHPLTSEEGVRKFYMGNVGFDITIPFKTIISNYKKYLDLGKNTRYFTNIKNDLINCETQEECETLLDNITKNYKIPQSTADKYIAELETLFDTKMTDISTAGQLPWHSNKNPGKYYNPLTACVHAGLLPILETVHVSQFRHQLSIYFTYFVADLFNRQKQDPDFEKEQSEILFVVDEVHNISNKSHRSGADELLRRCVKEGRPRRIGTILCTQNFNDLPDQIVSNTTHLICFKNTSEASKIANQYHMGKIVANMITDLDKHECIAYTTDKFIVYSNDGKRRESKLNEVFKGKTLPPYSMHKKPRT